MNNVTHLKSRVEPVVIDEAYFDGYSNDQLIYKATTGCDLAVDVLFEDGDLDPCAFNDARFEVFTAFTALKVLVARQLGRPYAELKADVDAAVLRRVLGGEGSGEVKP